MNISGAEFLITGGAGFIGSSLAEALVAQGGNVTVLDAMIPPYGGNLFNLHTIEKKITFIDGDVRSPSDVKEAVQGKDVIFHLAGQTGRTISMQNPILDTNINFIGTTHILEAIRELKTKPKMIFASSRGVIGMPTYLPVDESHPTNPRDVYGINKLAAEKTALLFGDMYDFGVTALRLNNVYGPRCQIKSNHYGTINLFIAYALQEKVLPIYGDGTQTRDYIYVEDVVNAFLAAISPQADNELYFVGTEKATSLLRIVELIKDEIPSTTFSHVAFPENLKSVDFPHFYSTSAKITDMIHWKPEVSLPEGIKKTVEFYSKHLQKYL